MLFRSFHKLNQAILFINMVPNLNEFSLRVVNLIFHEIYGTSIVTFNWNHFKINTTIFQLSNTTTSSNVSCFNSVQGRVGLFRTMPRDALSSKWHVPLLLYPTKHNIRMTSKQIERRSNNTIILTYVDRLTFLVLIEMTWGAHRCWDFLCIIHSKFFEEIFAIFWLIYKNSFIWLLGLQTKEEAKLTYHRYFKFTLHNVRKILT